MKVQVLHNEGDNSFHVLRPSDVLIKVFETELPSFGISTGRDYANIFYDVFNSYPEELHGHGHKHPAIVKAYRDLELRSLSRADVLVIDDTAYEVTWGGFNVLPEVPRHIVRSTDGRGSLSWAPEA